jgi:hypothetical protein
MTAPIKTKEELTRLAWITELRRQGHRQCTNGQYADANHRMVCALGLLREVAFPKASPEDREMLDDVEEVGALAGLSGGQSFEVGDLNDHTCNFAEIADVVEGWFK